MPQKNTKKIFLLVFIFFYVLSYVSAKDKTYSGFSFESFNCKDCDTILQNLKIKASKDPIGYQVLILLEEGRLLSVNQKHFEALNKFNESLEISINHKRDDLEAKSYHYIAYLYLLMNSESEAYLYFIKSSEIYFKLKDWDNFYTLRSNIGFYKSKLGRYDESESIMSKCIAYFQKTGNQKYVTSLMINLANIKVRRGDNIGSIHILKSLLDKKINNKNDLSFIYQNLAIAYLKLNNNNLAQYYIKKSIDVSESLKDELKLMELYMLKATILKNKQEYQLSNEYYLKSLNLALKHHKTSNIISIYEDVINNKILLKNYNDIPFYTENIKKWKDTLEKENFILSQSQADMEQKYINQKILNEKQVKRLNQEKSQKRIILLFTFSSVLLVFLLSFIFYHIIHNHKKNLNIVKLKELQLEKQQELEALENSNIKKELNLQKQEMLSSLIFYRNMNNEVKKVVGNIDKIASKSVISKQDMEKLKNDIIEKTNRQIQKSNFDNKLINVQTKFFTNILDEHPNLTTNELKVLAYLKVGLSTKEIADFQNITIEAVRKSRYRIRKKLNLEENDSLEQYIIHFS